VNMERVGLLLADKPLLLKAGGGLADPVFGKVRYFGQRFASGEAKSGDRSGFPHGYRMRQGLGAIPSGSSQNGAWRGMNLDETGA